MGRINSNSSVTIEVLMLGGISAQAELKRRLSAMQIQLSPQPIVSLIAGIAILLIPRLLNYIVAIYLIIIGVLGLGLIR